MLKAQVIGVGAAGNKAVLSLVKSQVVDIRDTMLVNSTTRDIPIEFAENQGKVVQIGNSNLSGCGKESSEGKRLAIEAIQNGTLNLDTFVNPNTDMVIVVTSTEGGTGSGASIVIAQYLKTVLGISTHIFAFRGFEEDVRGLYNTVQFFKSLREDYTVQAINNKSFLQAANGDFMKAEEMANTEFAIRISVLLGNHIKPAIQNIDRTDLLKTSTNYGYMDIQHREIADKIKNTVQFNEIIKDMIDESNSMDIDNPSQTLMGVIINIPESEKDAIDYSFSRIMDHYGNNLYEKYRHIQFEKGLPRSIAFICSGMRMPIKEVQDVYDRYVESTNKVNKEKDDFLSSLSDLDIDEKDNIFNLQSRRATNQDIDSGRNNFFAAFGKETPNVPKNNDSNKSVKSNKNDMKAY